MLTTQCTGGSTTNPTGCFTDKCPPGSTACCRQAKAPCRWNLTTPALSGEFFTYLLEQPYCVVSSTCATDSTFSVTFYPRINGTACSPDVFTYALVSLKRPMTAGELISLPNSRVSLSVYSPDSTKSCSQWTGTVSWGSDVPSWSITLNLTCSETGKSGIQLVGTFSGDA